MCIVTYLPKKGSSFILTFNRDEKTSRPTAEMPKMHSIHGQKVIFPKDPVSGGTWIGISFKGQTICLLNGAFEKHISDPPYRKSRGLVALDIFKYKNFQAFASQYEFTNIEPFTLIYADGISLQELRWDGKKINLKELDPKQAHIWSSVTLYSKEVISKRNVGFSKWLNEHKDYRVEDIRRFHSFRVDENISNDIIMKGEQKLTVSITSIVKENSSIKLTYEDLVNENLYMQSF
jgi:uncharacterized protein with NRDE domain